MDDVIDHFASFATSIYHTENRNFTTVKYLYAHTGGLMANVQHISIEMTPKQNLNADEKAIF